MITEQSVSVRTFLLKLKFEQVVDLKKVCDNTSFKYFMIVKCEKCYYRRLFKDFIRMY